jgi:hypothetical protein
MSNITFNKLDYWDEDCNRYEVVVDDKVIGTVNTWLDSNGSSINGSPLRREVKGTKYWQAKTNDGRRVSVYSYTRKDAVRELIRKQDQN